MIEEFKKIENDYIDFLNEVKRVIEKLLLKNNIPVAFNIYGRLKNINSIEEKHTSKRFIIKKSITELNDLVGIRIVLLFPEFKEKVIELLLSEFKQKVEYKSPNQNVEKFGYNSVHLILGIKDEWLSTPDWKEHSDKKIEVQIRTLSEHIWAETSHSLFYKREENIPKIITRDLYRLSALLEVVDEKMQNIKNRVLEHFEYIKNCPYEIILTLDLNSETFKRIMLEHSNGIYNLEENKNKELSSRIERDYNILNTNILENIIKDKINLEYLNNDKFIEEVLRLLEEDKISTDNKKNVE
jgi:putative GTP pyrophosphokinase